MGETPGVEPDGCNLGFFNTACKWLSRRYPHRALSQEALDKLIRGLREIETTFAALPPYENKRIKKNRLEA